MRSTLDIEGWQEPLAEQARKCADCTPANRQAGELLLGVVDRNFQSGGGPNQWAPLSAATLIARARGRTGKGKVFSYGHGHGPASSREAGVIAAAGKMPLWLRRIHGVDLQGTLSLTAKARSIVEGAKPLIFTGRLLRSNIYQAFAKYVDVGSNLVQAARLYFGSRSGERPETPPRNPFGLSASDRSSLNFIYFSFFRWGR